MKIRMRKNTRKRTASITFRAESDTEGVALRDAVMAAGMERADSGLPLRIVEGLLKGGVEKADFDLAVTTPKPRRRRSSSEAMDSRRTRQ